MKQRFAPWSLPGSKERKHEGTMSPYLAYSGHGYGFQASGRGQDHNQTSLTAPLDYLMGVRLTFSTIVLLISAIVLPVLSYSAANSSSLPGSFSMPSHTQPELAQLALQQPDAKVSVIVQRNGAFAAGTLASMSEQVSELGGVITKDLHIINGVGVDLPAGKVVALSRLSGVRWVSLDASLVKSATTATSTTVSASNLLNYYNSEVQADKVWQRSTAAGSVLQGQGIGIAIVDSGIALNQDFGTGTQSKVVAQVKTNAVALTTLDSYGHGTAVAGVAAGNGVNSQGQYIGIAPQANLIGVKVSDDLGNVKASDLVSGLQWLNDNKAKYNIRIVNISLNSSVAQSYNLDPLDAAAEVLWFNGIVVVASAGNNGTANLYAPANDPFVITVGAVDDAATPGLADDTVASFSAWGSDDLGHAKPDLVAPGKNLVTAIPSISVVLAKTHPEKLFKNSYITASGTSFAAPIVSGAIALLLQNEPNLNPDQVKNRLKATALQDVSRGTWDTRGTWPGYNSVQAGAGYLDIYSAVTQTQITATANTGQPISQMINAVATVPASSTAQAATTAPAPLSYTAAGYTASYTVNSQWSSNNGATRYYQVTVKLTNANTTAVSNWKAGWNLANGETISSASNANCTSSKATLSCGNLSSNGTIAAKGGTTSFTVTFSTASTQAAVTNPVSINLITNNVTTVLKGVVEASSTAAVVSTSVNWSSVNWSSVNWSSVNWSSVNWSSVNWSSDFWG